MSAVDYATGEILDVEAAERRASFICTDLDHAADTFESAMTRMREAIAERDDIALGYRSPGDYLSDRFGGRLARLGVDLRREVVQELTQAGMSTRAIAPVVGVDPRTVRRDQVGHMPHLSETPAASSAGATPAEQGPESPKVAPAEGTRGAAASAGTDDATATTPGGESPGSARPPVVGIDGKTYPRPMTPKPAPLVDEVGWDEQDRAEELAANLASNLSLLFAVTDSDRRAEYIANWRRGTEDRPVLGSQFVTPKHMRELSAALLTFADEWENAHV